MDPTVTFGLGMAVFFGAHGFAAFRSRGPGSMPERLGAIPYRAGFAAVSLLGLVLLIYGYGDLRGAAPVFYPPDWTRHVPLALMAPALILFVAAEAPMGHIKRIVKHPMLAGTKLWAFSHLVANGDLASVILFGAFLAFAVVDRIVVKRREASPGKPATIKGDIVAVVLGLGFYVAIVVWAHEAIIGVPVVA